MPGTDEFDHARHELVQGFGRYRTLTATHQNLPPLSNTCRDSLLRSGRGADMTIICEGQTLRYHSAIVCPRSVFFATAIWGSFKEGQTKVVVIKEKSLPMVRCMMSYFYLLDYDDEEEANLSEVEVNAQMYAMADEFGILGLKKVAIAKFRKRCHEYAALGWHPDTEAKPRHFKTMLNCVETVYTTTVDTDRILREILAKAIVEDIKSSPGLVALPEFKNTCLQFPEFAFKIIRTEFADAHAAWGPGATANTSWSQGSTWGTPSSLSG
ncbi:MAG: hypothetical protein LQ338_006537 [Usnochroma carphineum]|nr:MAG: hypothetical protein LQ338_006537 [Usnochroma carphineum]